MDNKKFDEALKILGPKLVLSIFRLSQKGIEKFEEKLNELVQKTYDDRNQM